MYISAQENFLFLDSRVQREKFSESCRRTKRRDLTHCNLCFWKSGTNDGLANRRPSSIRKCRH